MVAGQVLHIGGGRELMSVTIVTADDRIMCVCVHHMSIIELNRDSDLTRPVCDSTCYIISYIICTICVAHSDSLGSECVTKNDRGGDVKTRCSLHSCQCRYAFDTFSFCRNYNRTYQVINRELLSATLQRGISCVDNWCWVGAAISKAFAYQKLVSHVE